MNKEDIQIIHLERTIEWQKKAVEVLHSAPKILLKVLGAMDDNPSKDAPYHNNQHQMAVALRCMSLLEEEIQYLGRYSSKPTLVTREVHRVDPRKLFMAASLHDWGHTQGKEDDVHNILIASRRLEKVLDKSFRSADFVKQTLDVLQITQYPFTRQPYSLMTSIIRDADLLMCIEKDGEHFMRGLAKELHIDPDVFVKENPVWLASQSMYTNTGKALMREFLGLKGIN